MGIRFVPKVLKMGLLKILMIGTDGPIVRKARETRHRNDWSGEEEKEKIKPGYKKKSNGQLMKRGEKLSELKTVRVVGRNERTNVKLSNPFFHMFRRKHRFSL